MAVKMRLRRMGQKKAPFYRICLLYTSAREVDESLMGYSNPV